MNVTTWRQARAVLVTDSLGGIAARLGHLNERKINDLPPVQLQDGWTVTMTATKGVGMRIRHVLQVYVDAPEKECRWMFTLDVLGDHQTKNIRFPGMDVDAMTEDEFADFCFLPEIFADVVASELAHHYIKPEVKV